MIKSWVFEFFFSLREGGEAKTEAVKQRFDQYLGLWTHDEALGFDGIIFSEHHFGPGYSPSPNLLVAAMASRTKTLRLGTLGVSTAYATPLRIVEEAAMLDNLTDGRLEIGIVRGIPQELELLGMSLPEGDARFDASLRVVDEAFRSASGEFQCDGLIVVPPMRQANPPKWLAITSERSARRAASLKWKACSGFVSLEVLKKLFDAYREEAALDWAEAADMLGLRRALTFVENAAEAAEEQERLREFTISDFSRHGPRPAGAVHAPPAQQESGILDLDAMVRQLLSADDEFIVGTPADVADQIIHQCRTAGCAHFMVNIRPSNAFEDMARDHQIFGEQVIPILRKADLTSSLQKVA